MFYFLESFNSVHLKELAVKFYIKKTHTCTYILYMFLKLLLCQGTGTARFCAAQAFTLFVR